MNDTIEKLTAELNVFDAAIDVVEKQTLMSDKIRKDDVVLYRALQTERNIKRQELHEAWQVQLAPKPSFWKNSFRKN